MALVALNLRNVAITDRGWRVGLPVAQDEVIASSLPDVTFYLRSILQNHGCFGLLAGSQFRNLRLHLVEYRSFRVTLLGSQRPGDASDKEHTGEQTDQISSHYVVSISWRHRQAARSQALPVPFSAERGLESNEDATDSTPNIRHKRTEMLLLAEVCEDQKSVSCNSNPTVGAVLRYFSDSDLTSTSSTTKINFESGGMTPPAPLDP